MREEVFGRVMGHEPMGTMFTSCDPLSKQHQMLLYIIFTNPKYQFLLGNTLILICPRQRSAKIKVPPPLLTQSSEDIRTCKFPIEVDSIVLRVEHPTHPDKDDLQRAWWREIDD